jgi:multiple sugar transport system permease protein
MSRTKLLHRLGLFGLTIPVLLFIYLPIAWLVISSTSTRAELLSKPVQWIPDAPSLQTYLDILNPGEDASDAAKTFKNTLQNSLFIAAAVTAVSLFFGSMAAYALVRITFRFRRMVLLSILGTRMIPEISLVIPLYVIAAQLRILNTPYVLIATYLGFALPFTIWLMAAFFESIPVELEDAARIDGCSRLGILFRVILPISTPGLISTALFVFLLSWDEFFFALIFTSTLASKTVPVAIAEFTGRYVVDITGMMAGGVLAAIPPVVLALVFQRYIVRGLTAGAVKG